jgi:hypothetical protein
MSDRKKLMALRDASVDARRKAALIESINVIRATSLKDLSGAKNQVGLGVHNHHTRSLSAQSPAQSAQWCCWFGRRRSIFGSEEIAELSFFRLALAGANSPK